MFVLLDVSIFVKHNIINTRCFYSHLLQTACSTLNLPHSFSSQTQQEGRRIDNAILNTFRKNLKRIISLSLPERRKIVSPLERVLLLPPLRGFLAVS